VKSKQDYQQHTD